MKRKVKQIQMTTYICWEKNRKNKAKDKVMFAGSNFEFLL